LKSILPHGVQSEKREQMNENSATQKAGQRGSELVEGLALQKEKARKSDISKELNKREVGDTRNDEIFKFRKKVKQGL